MFFSFEGIDGVGKSTQAERFCRWLRERGCDVVACRDPGSTPLGEAIRELLLRREEIHLDARAEMLLYMAARAQMVDELIRPALERGQVVVSDRFLLANLVYQGHAGGLDVESIRQVGAVATGGIEPDRILLLDMPAELAESRMGPQRDRMEKRGAEHRRKLRSGYLAEAARQPERIVVIDAGGTADDVAAAVQAAALPLLGSGA